MYRVCLLCIAYLLILTGCISGVQVTQRDIQQTAVVLAPSGSHGVGPFAREGHVAFEGGLSVNTPSVSERSREAGQGGHVVTDMSGHLRVSGGPSEDVEISLNLALASAQISSSALASDLSFDHGQNTFAWSLSPGFRALLAGDESAGLGLLLELDFQLLPYHRDVREVEFFFPSGDGSDKPEIRDKRSFEADDTAVFLDPRIGLFGSFRPAENVHLSIGGVLHTYPLFFGEERADERCAGMFWCQGPASHTDVSPYEYTFMSTLFATVSVDVGPVTFITHLYGHPYHDPALEGLTPFGGDLRIRYNF